MSRRPQLVAGALAGVAAIETRWIGQAAEMIAAASHRLASLTDDDNLTPGALWAYPGDRGYDLIEDLAVVPVEGVLVPDLGCLRPLWGYVTGYDGIRQSLANAFEDAAVRGIVMRINSPGGLVAGCFDLCDEIFDTRGKKPMAAVLAENACSAAYALASAVDVITVPRTGYTGSVGVIQERWDISGLLERQGVAVEYFTPSWATRKADGHPECPVSDEERAAAAADMDALGDLFANTVARNRGLSAQAVKDLAAGCFLGPAGVEAGLADLVKSPTQALRALARL